MGRLPAPEARRQTAATILQQRPRTILVLGGWDAGRTWFALAACALGSGPQQAVQITIASHCRSLRMNRVFVGATLTPTLTEASTLVACGSSDLKHSRQQ